MQSNGLLEGCTLVYQAVVADYAYRAGKPVVLVGNIGVRFQSKALTLFLKVGVSDILTDGKASFERPHFAYLQTATATTAKARHVIGDGDPGFRLFVVTVDDEGAKIIGEIIATKKVTIGFNRRENGLDVLVPLELTVTDTNLLEGKVLRQRSDVAIQQFKKCVSEVLG